MTTDVTQEQIIAMLDAIRATDSERPPNTFRTEELCEALGCKHEKARRMIHRLLKEKRAQPVRIFHRYDTGVERWVMAWQLTAP